MTIRERVAKRQNYKERYFVVIDPEFGIIPSSVEEFSREPPDSPRWDYEVVEQEAHEP